MDIMRSAIRGNTEELERADFDGKLLFSKDGEAPEEVKQLPEYQWVMDELRD